MKVAHYREPDDFPGLYTWHRLNPTGKVKTVTGGNRKITKKYVQHRHHFFFKKWINECDIDYFEPIVETVMNGYNPKKMYSLTIEGIVDHDNDTSTISYSTDAESIKFFSAEAAKKGLTTDQFLANIFQDSAYDNIDRAIHDTTSINKE